jgi:CheY-like chemotaxis protein
VRDTGRGMTEPQLAALFDEYKRFETESNQTIEGAGLGMSIVRNLLKLMNGEIKAESKPYKGSLITVRIPQEIVGDEVLGKELAANLSVFHHKYITRKRSIRKKPTLIPDKRVLVVDDVETNLDIAVEYLELYGLQIETAESGGEAIAKVKTGMDYDIIFMDHMMYGLDGVETTDKIRNIGFKGPIIALTASTLKGQKEMFLVKGFDYFISKPIDAILLDEIVNKYLKDSNETTEISK